MRVRVRVRVRVSVSVSVDQVVSESEFRVVRWVVSRLVTTHCVRSRSWILNLSRFTICDFLPFVVGRLDGYP